MTPSGVSAKGLFLGHWQYTFLERVGWDRAALIRIDVLCPGLPPLLMLKRAAARMAFWFLDNPLTIRILVAWARHAQEKLAYGSLLRHIHYRSMLAGYQRSENLRGSRPN